MTEQPVGPHCGNNPNVRLTDHDRKAVADFKARLTLQAAVKPYVDAAAWVDGDPLMEVTAATVWKHCTRDDQEMPQAVCDDPRTIAAFAAAVARAHAAAAPSSADRAAVERVRAVLETEAVVGRSALEYRGLIVSALAAVEAQPPQPECAASISGNCLAEAQSERPCDTDDGECVHGGRPAADPQPVSDEFFEQLATAKVREDDGAGAQQQPDIGAQPFRGDQFEQWLKGRRDEHGWQGSNDRRLYDALDIVLDRYRLHADTGTPLGEHVCERASSLEECDCLEPAPVTQQPTAEARCTCADAGDCFAPAGHYADCPLAEQQAAAADGEETRS